VLAGGAAWYGARVYDALGPLEASRVVVIPRGSPGLVADALAEAGVITSPLAFRVAAYMTMANGRLHAGELAFPERTSLREAFVVLRTAKPVQHRLTIPEGLTAVQIARLLDRAEALTGDDKPPPEGAMLPQTYAYDYGATRASLVERASVAMQKALAQAWSSRAKDLPLTDPLELVTIASMVERETARPEERPHIAGVFYNRLRHGMRLQSDPTVAYAVSAGLGNPDHPLTRADLDVASPYNTYRNNGLPPGPIASPGVASLEAAAQPDVTDDLYFVADGAGGHAFARTLDEHLRNVTRWRAVTPSAAALLLPAAPLQR
jgi:UPF0755 protein